MAVLILFHPSIRSSGGLATYLTPTQSDERKTGKLEKSNQMKEKQANWRKAIRRKRKINQMGEKQI